ncbi:MAG: hypothetical protein LW772_09175, partial [Bacteroidetes bacterium]|nr:hypothetical protein [Bacteroidota bacterium]
MNEVGTEIYRAHFVDVNQPQALKSQDKSSWVNTFIGTDGTGHTFPGPSMPFGMVQP